eukprot:146940-Rhodomonas_salina.1
MADNCVSYPDVATAEFDVLCNREKQADEKKPFVRSKEDGPCTIVWQRQQTKTVLKVSSSNAIPGTDEANIYDVTLVWDGDEIVETSVILMGECHVNAERTYHVRVKYDRKEKR